MKNVKLLVGMLVGTINYEPGQVVQVPDLRADEMVKYRGGVYADPGETVANPDDNKLGDSIDPLPPGVVHLDVTKAGASNAATSRDLANLVVATGRADQVAPDGTTGSIAPVSTHPDDGQITPENAVRTLPAGPPNSGVGPVHPDVTDQVSEEVKAQAGVFDGPPGLETATKKPGTRNAAKVTGKAE